MEYLVSVIIPAYNVGTYIQDCVNSVLAQTYPHIEVLLIDDGSTDGTLNVCELLSKQDSRVKVWHKENGGVSSARNLGIQKATGDYVMFVDGDDWLETWAIEMMLQRITSTGADACFCNQYFINEYELNRATSLSSDQLIDSIEVARQHLHYGFISSPCLSIVNKEKMMYVSFNESIHTLEDWLYNFELLLSIKTVTITNKPYYHYRAVLGSASKSPLNERKMTCLQIPAIVQKLVESRSPQLLPHSDFVIFFLLYHLLVIYSTRGCISNEDSVLKHIARANIKKVLSSNLVGGKMKIYVILSAINPAWFKYLYLIKNRRLHHE